MKVSKGTGLIILGAVLVLVDQVIKVLVKTNMDLGQQIYLIGDWWVPPMLCGEQRNGVRDGVRWKCRKVSALPVQDMLEWSADMVDTLLDKERQYAYRGSRGADSYYSRGYREYN